jgi:molybdopterin-guanine dinucleotide biosynthesis protein A
VLDPVSGAGPLAGIAAGLSAARTPWLVVLAGDMPYITADLVDRLLAARGDDAVGVRVNGLPEPLVCRLHRRVLPVVEGRITAGRYKASGLLTDEGLRVTWIDWGDADALRNVNSPEDLPPRGRE